MGRRFGQFKMAAWGTDFGDLTRLQQHAYWTLLFQPKLTLVGTLDFIPGRIMKAATDWTGDELEQVVKELESLRYVVVDRDTQELLIRSFVRHDPVLTTPNVAQGMSSDFGEVMSTELQDVIVKELQRAYTEGPDLGGWKGVAKGNPVLYRRVTGRDA